MWRGILRKPVPAWRQLLVVGGAGAVAGVLLDQVVPLILALLLGWDVAALVYLTWIWMIIWPLDHHETARLAEREDPSRPVRDAILLLSGLASLLGITALLITSQHWHGVLRNAGISVAVVTVIVSWAVVHTVFSTLYAGIYYREGGGVDFHQAEPPRFSDFAYMSFIVGTTFQVADTDLTSSAMRVPVLRHLLLSYLFGAVLIAATVNLLAGLAR